VAAGSVLNLRRRTAGGYSDSGGVSRYFFCTKAASRERDAGVPAGSPRHPCIKPLSLTTWLARLILPPTPGAVVLVPFAGTGSEMIGALQAGWAHVVGIEREAEYVATARARLAHWCPASAGASPPACGESETGI
jgi:site-specific DNA-methyltransferase (adenine-specific)